ncbi:MAG: hypothetical protein C0407_09195 [Desulfobacca sp.]|nr:hypothetical protein [Desulfobacca sp.]
MDKGFVLKNDDWGLDPQVQFIRRLFSGMEKAQRDFFNTLGLSPYDQRLGPWRQATLNLFEKVWALSAGRGLPLEEKDIVQAYLHCLISVLGRQNMAIPAGLLQENAIISDWIKEVQR